MTEHPLRLVRKSPDLLPKKVARHPLGQLDSSRYAKHLLLFRAEQSMLDHMVVLASPHIPGMAGTDIVRKVHAHNPDCVWVLARKRKFNQDRPFGEGFVAMLPLNAKGLHRLATKNFNGADPDLSLVTKPGEKPAGIYIWGTYAPGIL